MSAITVYPLKNWTDADKALGTRDRKKVANNTWLERHENTIALRLHNTDIVTWATPNRAILNVGGWFTVTTANRINQVLPNGVSQYSKRGRWMLKQADGTAIPWNDGMMLDTDTGIVVDGLPDLQAIADQDKANDDMRKAIRKHVAGITPERIVEAFENPGGDPWCCLMVTDNGEHPFGQGECPRVHVEDDYFTLATFRRAIKARGYFDPDVIVYSTYSDAKNGKVSWAIRNDYPRWLRKNILEGVAVS